MGCLVVLPTFCSLNSLFKKIHKYQNNCPRISPVDSSLLVLNLGLNTILLPRERPNLYLVTTSVNKDNPGKGWQFQLQCITSDSGVLTQTESRLLTHNSQPALVVLMVHTTALYQIINWRGLFWRESPNRPVKLLWQWSTKTDIANICLYEMCWKNITFYITSWIWQTVDFLGMKLG